MERGNWAVSSPVCDTSVGGSRVGEMTSPTWKMSKPGAGLGPEAGVSPLPEISLLPQRLPGACL